MTVRQPQPAPSMPQGLFDALARLAERTGHAHPTAVLAGERGPRLPDWKPWWVDA